MIVYNSKALPNLLIKPSEPDFHFNIVYKFSFYIKQYSSGTKTNQLMLFREAVIVCFENHLKQKTTFCGKNSELQNDKAAGSYSY
jgi:hypothetical protein